MIDNFGDNRGTITQTGNLMRVQNALVEEVSSSGRNTGSILISYSVPRRNGTTAIEMLQLNVGSNTMITNRAGLNVDLQDVQAGSYIDAIFSPVMTRSMPPQSAAFLVVVRQQVPRPPQQPPSDVTTDRVASVDYRNNVLTTGHPRNTNQQIRFIITNDTVITNRNGRTVSLRAIRPGDRVRITHSNAMTASIPPQTTAFRIEQL
jgi:hypothetical protein